MNGITTNNEEVWKRINEIRYDSSKASLEDLEEIFSKYNKGPILIDGVRHHFNINPMEAACLNERYKELTGKDNSAFLEEQLNVLNECLNNEVNIKIDGNPSIYQMLKNNLTGKGQGITILDNYENSYLKKYDKIKYDISNADLNDVKDILDHYKDNSVLINGMVYHMNINPIMAASLNGRFKELTGYDNKTYLEVKNKKLKEEINNSDYKVNGMSNYNAIKNNDLEVGNKKHVIFRSGEILANLDESSLEDISSLLDYYNGKPVIIEGMAHHPFNDPLLANRLNSKYKEKTGKNHPHFLQEAPNIIKGLKKDRNLLLGHGQYTEDYFDKLDIINNNIKNDTKNSFLNFRNIQHMKDSLVRKTKLFKRNQRKGNIEVLNVNDEQTYSGGIKR